MTIRDETDTLFQIMEPPAAVRRTGQDSAISLSALREKCDGAFQAIDGRTTGMSRKKARKSTDGGENLTHRSFGALAGLSGLPPGPEDSQRDEPEQRSQGKTSKRRQKNMKRGRVDIIRQTAHRGGKAVTVVKNFTGIGQTEKQELAKKMQKACGVGGTVKDGCIEIQGDKREEVKRILMDAGFQPVFAGG